MNNNTIDTNQIFFKLFEKEYRENLKNGELYFNTCSFFRKEEEKEIEDFSKDRNEGLTTYNNKPCNVFIQKLGDNKNPIIKLGTGKYSKLFDSSKLPYTHIFCFSYQKIELNKKIEFYVLDHKDLYPDKEYYTIFTTYHLNLILESLYQQNLKPTCEKVRYIDLDKIAQEERLHLDGFTKDIKFHKEQEIRIGITLPTKEGILINIHQVLDIPIISVNNQFNVALSDSPNFTF